MGTDKAGLLLGGQSLLERTCRTLQEAADNVFVCAAKQQQLPPLPPGVVTLYDTEPDQGPLCGFVSALLSLNAARRPSAVYVTACDSPFQNAAVIHRLWRRWHQAGSADAVVPIDDQRAYPLHAVYSTAIVSNAERAYRDGLRSMHRLLQQLATVKVPVSTLTDLDPALLFLRNVNTPEELEEARRILAAQ